MIMHTFRVPEYLESDGAVKTWPRYNLEDRNYLIFDKEKSEEGQGLWTENKRFINEVIEKVGAGRKTPPSWVLQKFAYN